MELQGRHFYTLDDKGRFKLPNELLCALGTSFTVTRGKDGCLWALPDPEWKRMKEHLSGDLMLDDTSIALQRWFVGSAEKGNLDTTGRLTLSPTLRSYVGIAREIVVQGTGRLLELWPKDKWEAYHQPWTEERINALAEAREREWLERTRAQPGSPSPAE